MIDVLDIDTTESIRFKNTSISMLHHAVEGYWMGLMEDSNLFSIHHEKKTIKTNDLTLVKTIRKDPWDFESKTRHVRK